ncbi:non-ribosomal peptide synthetase [Vibrio proteolyticus]|uniref:non-ribosomal peptide synthetase n=1 Tax=Vibrio proteolyticus TaxID=671 RepID=UPI0003F6638B|nr:non-ribosomal peptide synthetase [Vibrio proteolyticus]
MSVDDIGMAPAQASQSPLSYSQQRLWLFHQLKPESLAYNNGGLLWLTGKDVSSTGIQSAYQAMLDHFSGYRLRFNQRNGEPYQYIASPDVTPLEILDFSQHADPAAAVQQDAKARALAPYALLGHSLVRGCIYHLGSDQYALLLAAHHLIVDAWSLKLSVEFIASALQGAPLPKASDTSYLDFVAEEACSDDELAQRAQAWQALSLIGDEPCRLSSQSEPSYRAAHYLHELDVNTAAELNQATKCHGITRFELLSAALSLTLQRYTNHTHPSLMVQALNRSARHRRNVGFYVSNVVLGQRCKATRRVSDYLQATRATLKQSLQFAAQPLEKLCGELALPTFAFNFRSHGEGLNVTTADFQLQFQEFPVVETPFELVLDVVASDQLTLRFVYAEDKFSADFIEGFVASYQHILQGLCQQPQASLASLDGLSAPQQIQLEQFAGSNEEWSPVLFTELFARQVLEQPQAIALKHGSQTLSYQQLDQRSNQLAHCLLEQGISPDTPVAVLMERGTDMLVAMIAVLKAGGAFLPLDPDYPKERLSFMLADSQAKVVLTQAALTPLATELTAIPTIATDALSLEQWPASTPDTTVLPQQLAYLIYTSGSTGTPKGVAVDHLGLSMHVQTIGQRYGMTPQDTELHFASISFDGAVERWTVPLAFGSKLVIRDQQLWTPEQTTQVLSEENVTIACFPPSYIGPLLDWIELTQPNLSLRSVTLGGEAFTRETFERIQKVIAPPRIINGYGPTETVVTPMIWSAYPEDALTSAYAPIGTAVGARQLYVLDQNLTRLPPGTIGELYIGMEVGLARGYLDRADLTAERFLPDPFSANGERMYRTGDLVRFRHDGVMEYFGRVDQQVKIRGFRVELGEIESRLQTLTGAEFCAVTAHDSPTGKKLVGYVQLPAMRQSEEHIWLSKLSDQLPDYMVPSRVMVDERLPLTPAGKVDRKCLPEPDWSTLTTSTQPLQGDKQHTLAKIWCEILKLDVVGADSHFFALGGDSISALQLVGKLRQQHWLLTPKQVFDHPVLAELAECMTSIQVAMADQHCLRGDVALLPMQQRFLHNYQLSPCNQYVRLSLPAPVDVDALHQAMKQLIDHHDALRLTFSANSQTHSAHYAEQVDFAFHLFADAIDSETVQLAVAPEQGRTVSVGVNAERGDVLLTIHHLVVDALSWPILLNDLLAFYQAKLTGDTATAAAKTHHQADWHQALMMYPISAREHDFWQAQQQAAHWGTNADSDVHSLQWALPTDKAVQLFASTQQFAKLDKESTLLALVLDALRTVKATPSLLVHKESHGRYSELSGLDLSRSVNWHTAMYPLHIDIPQELGGLLAQVKDQVLAVEHGGIGYSAGVVQNQWQYASEIDVLFNYLGRAANAGLNEGLVTDSGLWRPAHAAVEAAVTLNIHDNNEQLLFDIEVDGEIFPAAERQRLLDALSQSWEAMLRYCQEQDPILTVRDAPDTGLEQCTLTALSHQAKRLPQRILPLSTLQQGLYFHARLSEARNTYVNQITLPIHGADPARLADCWQQLMRRHSVLRSTVSQIDGQAQLMVWDSLEVHCEQVDGLKQPSFSLEAYKQGLVEQGFELEQPLNQEPQPLWRLDLVRTGADQLACIFTIHHILIDGWSTGVLLGELFGLYQGKALPAVQHQFGDYLQWVSQQPPQKAAEYWQQYLSAVEAPTKLADGYGHGQEQGHVRFNLDIDNHTLNQWQHSLQQNGLTLNTLIQAAWLLTLQRYTGQSQPVFGNTVAGRPTSLTGSESMVGLFINTLPVTSAVNWQYNIAQWMSEIQAQTSAQREFSYASLAEVQAQSPLQGETLFDTLMVFENYPLDEHLFRDSGLSVGEPDSYEFTHYPLTLAVLPGEQLRIVFAYDSARFSHEDMQALSATTHHYLQQLVANIGNPLSAVPVLDEAQHQQLNQYHKISEPWQYVPFPELLKRQVQVHAEHEALVASALSRQTRSSLTYRQLHERSDAVAAELVARGIRRDERVGVLFERGSDMLVAMIGVMKAGGAFLPLDPSYPQERLTYMLNDSGAKCLMCDSASQSLAQEMVDEITAQSNDVHVLPFSNLDLSRTLTQAPVILPDQLAYVIYTSGSTGQPKGVCVSHLGLSMHVQTIGQRYGMLPEDRELHFASISFDGAVERWTVPLAFGSTLVIRDQQLWSAQETTQVLEEERITIACFPPSYVGPLLEWIEATQPALHVRSWTLGGEAFTRETYFRLQSTLNPPRIINGYGPTETVVTPMIWQAYPQTSLDSAYAPIGTAVGARTLYVLDSELRPVPPGVNGELYIGEEVGLARGYLDKPDLSAERFMPDPFAANGERMYRTGDLVRWREDGVMEYLGRADDQIKIRGFRIELGEIEARLQQISQSKLSAVTAFDGPAGKYLVGYLQSSDDAVDTQHILDVMASQLPDYMVPSQLVVMETLPLTPASKVDKKRLPSPQHAPSQTQYQAPQGEMEQLLAAEWQQLFAQARVSRLDDFFALGGQSLLATQLVGRLQHKHGVRLALQSVFDAPQLAKMAALCEQTKESQMTLQAQQRLDYMPASAAQKRLWFVQQLLPESSAYHMPFGLKLTGPVDANCLDRALQHLISQHEVLRTALVQVDGELMQQILPYAEFSLEQVNATTLTSLEQHRLARIDQAFDLTAPPLLRADLIQTGVQEYELLLVVHHIVSDGVSMQQLVRKLAQYYASLCAGESLDPTTPELDYADYAIWQQQWLTSDAAGRDLKWWQQALQQDIEPLVLHSDVAREQLKTKGERHHFMLSETQISQITQLAKQHNTTAFNVLLSLWHLVLHKYSGRDEIRVGIPVAGRTQPQTLEMQGCFINNLVVPAQIDATHSYTELLANIKQFTEQALSRQDVPFETLVETLGVTGNLQHHPLYQTSFNFQQLDSKAFTGWGALEAELFDPGVAAAQLELSLDVQQYSDGRWGGFINYASPVFDEGFAQGLLMHWLLLLEQVADNSARTVAELNLVDSEQLAALAQFNATEHAWGEMLPPPLAIMRQAAATPQATALVMGEEVLTYAEFDRRVNQLANWLRTQGVREESRVGLGLPRSIELVIGLHAITRAGGAYVPLDPGYPQERLNYILESADVSLLLTDQSTQALWPDNPHCQYVALDTLDVSQQPDSAPDVAWHADQALYVIFTSGSTGLPKGVVNTQSALHNRLAWMQGEYQLDSSDCVLQKTPFSFDVSVWEFFWPLMYGARLAVAEPEAHRQPEWLHRTIQNYQVTTIHFVPSMLQAFAADTDVSACLSLKRILCSGEALPAELSEKVLTNAPHCQLHNLYGPTEAAIDVSYWQCQLPVGKRIPIGHAISNTQLHVLDDCWNPVPVGVPGELYLAGDGLAREYLLRADLTADRFVPNPWGAPGSRMYRTGDQVVRLPDGRLEYLGRLDHQVKIRGLRIELEEIENVLNQLAWVEESAVVAFEHQTGTQLVAYVICANWHDASQDQVKAHLGEHLPDYMVPSVYVSLTSMPLSPNGKRDRKALPDPQWHQVAYRAPASELELWFAQRWQDALQLDRVGLDDNFFALGGHSLLATRIVAQAQKELGLNLTLKAFFSANTLQALTDNLQPQYQTQNEQEQDELDAMAALMDELELL